MDLMYISVLSLIFCCFVAVQIIWYILFDVKTTKLYMSPNSIHKNIAKKIPSLPIFYPNFFLSGPHQQTIGGKFLRSMPKIPYRRELIIMKDGTEIGLDWDTRGDHLGEEVPTVIVVHGLVGSSSSKYMRSLVNHISTCGWRSVAFNARGCGNTCLKIPMVFSASWTSDIKSVVEHVNQKYPKSPLLGVGFSLGSNIMTKYLGEEGSNTPFRGVVGISNPFNLVKCNNELGRSEKWSHKFYNRYLTKDCVAYLKRHQEVLGDAVDIDYASQAQGLQDFDKRCILKIHSKYRTLEDYYKDASCSNYLSSVCIPALYINSADDPVVPSVALPIEQFESNPNVVLAVTERGGHTAFLKSWNEAWSDEVAMQFLQSIINPTSVKISGATSG